MRTLAWLSMMFLVPQTVQASTFVYVSVAAEKRIAVYESIAESGKLLLRAHVPVEAGEPGALTTDPAKRILFVAIRSTGKLSAYRIHPGTGRLLPLNTVPAGPDPAQISTDATGRFLLTAYYVDAKVTVHAIDKEGKLSEKPLQTIPTATKAHAIIPDPSNRFVFVPHTGPNVIFQFAFDSRSGRLSPGNPPRLSTPKNTGPRHLVFHPRKPLAYVVNEQGSSVTVYQFDPKGGTLSALQTVSTLTKGFKGENACAEIKLHPSAKFLYASNRGEDSIACFGLDEAGKLSALGNTPTEKTPRSFDLDPSGKYLFAAGEGSGKVVRYRINGQTGALKPEETYEVGKMPWWVLSVALPDK